MRSILKCTNYNFFYLKKKAFNINNLFDKNASSSFYFNKIQNFSFLQVIGLNKANNYTIKILSILIINQKLTFFFTFYRGYEVRNGSARMEPRAIAKAPEGEGCPRCGGCVYAAEQMLARGRVS